MRLIDGNLIAQEVLAEIKARVARLAPVIPHVAFIRVGEDPASVSYVTKKQKTAAEVGMQASIKVFSEAVTQAELFKHIDELNADKSVHGILIQAPLPKHLSETEVFNRVASHKDVDGFGTLSIGKLVQEIPGAFAACTPAGVIELLKRSKIETTGKHAVVVVVHHAHHAQARTHLARALSRTPHVHDRYPHRTPARRIPCRAHAPLHA